MTPEQQSLAEQERKINEAVDKLCLIPEAMTLLTQTMAAQTAALDKLADAIGNLAQSNEELVNSVAELIAQPEDEESDAEHARAAGRTLADED